MTFSLHTALFSSFFHKLPGQESGQSGIGGKNPRKLLSGGLYVLLYALAAAFAFAFSQKINGCLADYLIKNNEHRRQDEDYACHTDQGTS